MQDFVMFSVYGDNKSWVEKVEFKNYESYDRLPPIAKGNWTKKLWDEWKKLPKRKKHNIKVD